MVGVGVNHDELVKHAEVSFGRVPEGMSTIDEQCEYVGGELTQTLEIFTLFKLMFITMYIFMLFALACIAVVPCLHTYMCICTCTSTCVCVQLVCYEYAA